MDGKEINIGGKKRPQKVEKGQSLESYAKAYDPSWTALDLAFVNWQTRNCKRINKHLWNEVGCYKRTADGNNFMFQGDEDKPHPEYHQKGGTGIIWIPVKEQPQPLAADQTHLVTVEEPDTWIRFYIENEFSEPVPNVRVKIALEDESVVCDFVDDVKTDANGMVEIKDKSFVLGDAYTIELNWEDVEKNRSNS